MSNKIGNEKVLAILHFLVPALALGITLGPTLMVVAVFFVIRGSAANMSRPTWNAFFYSWLPPKYRGTSTGFVSAGRRLSRALGTMSGVFIYEALLAWTFPIATLGYPIAIMIPIIVQRFLKNRRADSQEEPATVTDLSNDFYHNIDRSGFLSRLLAIYISNYFLLACWWSLANFSSVLFCNFSLAGIFSHR